MSLLASSCFAFRSALDNLTCGSSGVGEAACFCDMNQRFDSRWSIAEITDIGLRFPIVVVPRVWDGCFFLAHSLEAILVQDMSVQYALVVCGWECWQTER